MALYERSGNMPIVLARPCSFQVFPLKSACLRSKHESFLVNSQLKIWSQGLSVVSGQPRNLSTESAFGSTPRRHAQQPNPPPDLSLDLALSVCSLPNERTNKPPSAWTVGLDSRLGQSASQLAQQSASKSARQLAQQSAPRSLHSWSSLEQPLHHFNTVGSI